MNSRIFTRSLWISLFFYTVGCTAEIYFPSDTYNYLLGPDTQVNTTIAEVIALSKKPSQHIGDISYSLEALRLEGNCTAKNRFNGEDQQLFAIENSTNGRVVQTQKLAPYSDFTGCTFKLLVSARNKIPVNEEVPTRKSTITSSGKLSMPTSPTADTDKVKTVIQLKVSMDSTACFAEPYVRLQIFLTSPPGIVYVLNSRPSPGGYSTGNSFEYELVGGNANHPVTFNNLSTELTFSRKVHQAGTFYLSVQCSIKSTTDSSPQRKRRSTETVNIAVTVLHDHEDLLTPILPEKIFLVLTEKRIENQTLETLTPSKSDTYGWTMPEVRIASLDNYSSYYRADFHEEEINILSRDNFSLLSLMDFQEKKLPKDVVIDFSLKKNLKYTMDETHFINVTIWNNDTENTPSNWSDIPARTIIIYQIEIKIIQMEFKFENNYLTVSVFRNASSLSRIAINAVPPYISAGRNIAYLIDPLNLPGDAIQLGENSGILYIKENNTELQTTSYTNLTLTMRAIDITDDFAEENAVSIVEIYLKDTDPSTCHAFYCSQFADGDTCTSTCGIGSPSGWCKWRPDTSKNFKDGSYATCSPDFTTCPDKICDEIEEDNPQICPQDCTEKVSGAGPSIPGEIGIPIGFGTCKCDMKIRMETSCTCFRPQAEPEVTSSTAANLSSVNLCPLCNPANDKHDKVITIPVLESNAGPCDIVCIIVLSSVGCVFLALIVVGLFVSKRYPCSGRVAGTQYKPGLIGTADGLLNTIPSEYVDDGFMLQRIKSEYDAKWEFPRTNLVLEEILGEGEFGRVMMAQALSIRGHTGYQTVAVKMLKNNATNAELQDLITELSLLKQVNHPNVVRLLGASTQKGPLFVIVEYCKHGSLKMFLRQNRKTPPVTDDYMGTEHEPMSISIGPRDLMSFAWQVCKGMHYLASMKLVHRDLAARNVLVADGLIIKISDFGLTRDIYEGDTYMKKSKSRMPVKWMAIEALYDNIYTIKSDVWSFGVLLWEIVTMGATPYPGLPSERLYQILKNGFRMDKPDGCSDELFRLMQRCWQLVPASRPSFFDLADIFEKMLEKDSEYLDLSAELPIDSDDDEDKEDKAEASAVFRPVQQVNEEEETSLKVLLSNASYNTIPGACKSNETSFTGSPIETDQENIGEEDSYYCGEYTKMETV